MIKVGTVPPLPPLRRLGDFRKGVDVEEEEEEEEEECVSVSLSLSLSLSLCVKNSIWCGGLLTVCNVVMRSGAECKSTANIVNIGALKPLSQGLAWSGANSLLSSRRRSMAQEGGRLDGAEGVTAGLMCCACCSLCSVGRGKHAIAVAACTVAAAHLLYRYAPRISQLGIGGAESWGRARRVKCSGGGLHQPAAVMSVAGTPSRQRAWVTMAPRPSENCAATDGGAAVPQCASTWSLTCKL